MCCKHYFLEPPSRKQQDHLQSKSAVNKDSSEIIKQVNSLTLHMDKTSHIFTYTNIINSTLLISLHVY